MVACAHKVCVPHASGLFLGEPELGLAKVGHRHCRLAEGGLVGAGLVRRDADREKGERKEREERKERKRK